MTMMDTSAPVASERPRESEGEVAAMSSILVTSLSGSEIRTKLDAAARKGRLPGLRKEPAEGALFEVRELGRPFESALIAIPETVGTGNSAGGSVTRLAFRLRMRMLIPVIFAVSLIVSVWPGIYIVDSMLKHYFSWYTIQTWWWYLPLTVPTSPWAFWVAMKKSRAAAIPEAEAVIKKIAAELGAGLEGAASGTASGGGASGA